MKILVVIDPVVPVDQYNTVGSTNAAVQLCLALSAKGVNVTLAGNYGVNDEIEPINGLAKLNIYPSRTRLYMKQAFQVIDNHLNEDNSDYDSISIQISTPSVAKYILDMNTSIPIYFTMHSWTGTRSISYNYKDIYRRLVSADKCKFIFLCNSQAQVLFDSIEMSPKNYYVEPNGVLGEISNPDTTKVGSILPSKFLEEGYYVTVARFVRSKHVYDVVDACIKYNKNLLVIGDDWINDKDYSDSVNELINSSDRIVKISNISNVLVLAMMKLAKATVLYTDVEVCNLTIIESSLMGTPVVAGPRSSGLSESIDNLKDGGLEELVFPFRSKYNTRLRVLSETMDRASTHRYDISKFPDCYKWDIHVENMYKILTNKGDSI